MTEPKKKILVAEDNRIMAKVLSFNLQHAGFDVTVACNGREAVESLQTNRFDLILTDYQMPELDGGEFCLRAREQAEHADVPIFMLTAKGFELDAKQLAEKYSISGILPKPFSPMAIRALVEETLCGAAELS